MTFMISKEDKELATKTGQFVGIDYTSNIFSLEEALRGMPEGYRMLSFLDYVERIPNVPNERVLTSSSILQIAENVDSTRSERLSLYHEIREGLVFNDHCQIHPGIYNSSLLSYISGHPAHTPVNKMKNTKWVLYNDQDSFEMKCDSTDFNSKSPLLKALLGNKSNYEALNGMTIFFPNFNLIKHLENNTVFYLTAYLMQPSNALSVSIITQNSISDGIKVIYDV